MKNTTLKRLFVACIAIASATASFAQKHPDERYKGGNVVVEAGGLVGTEKFGMSGISLAFLGGHTFSEHLFVGGGVGFNSVKVKDLNSYMFPFFARVKYSLLKSKVTPYISLDAGYNVGHDGGPGSDPNPSYDSEEGYTWVKKINGGVILRPELGISVRLKKRQSVNFGVGYDRYRGEFQRKSQTRNLEKNALNAVTFRIGLTL